MLLWLIFLCYQKALPEAFILTDQATMPSNQSVRVSTEVSTGGWNL